MPQELIAQILAKAAQRLLASDPDSFMRLLKNHDKTIALTVSGTGLRYCFLVTADGIEGNPGHQEVDVEFIAGPLTLLRLARYGYQPALVNDGLLTIMGDMETGRRLARLFSTLDIDWEGLVAQYTGTILAHRVGVQVRSLLQWRGKLHNNLWSTAGETLTEERNILAPALRIELFNHAVDNLHTDTERLAARIRRLQKIFTP
ncbi:MAG TPA: hypothetical protein ENI62_02460 [Gammaproteobacteria bacterium]|nr:hypothetical protein [Gammaproteobacteria bacterium]